MFDSCFQQSGTTTRVAKRAPSCQSGPLQNTFWCLLVLLLSILVSWNSAAAQDGKKESVPKKIKPDTSAKQIKAKGQQLINQAYQLTTTAQEPEEFEQIIKLCKHALMEELPKRHQEYTKRLLSWAHNKRGEARSDEASQFAAEGNIEKAEELDKLALKDFETAIVLDKGRWKAYHNRGVNSALQGDYEAAIEDFEKTIELHPRYVNAWFNLGEIYFDSDDYDRAIENYAAVIELRSEDADAFRGRGNSYFNLGLYRKALADFDSAVTLQPGDAMAHAERADVYSRLQNWSAAAADYRQAIELDNELGRAYQGAAWIMATCPQERFRNKDRALQAARRAIELDGDDDFRYLDTIAAAHAANGNYEDAQDLVNQAIDIAPEDEHVDLEKRRALYDSQKPFRQISSSPRVTRR